MSHRCGALLADGHHCSQPVADPDQPDCGRHGANGVATAPCRVVETDPGQWRCLAHGEDAWQVAVALGAAAPCQIDKSLKFKLDLVRHPLDAQTAMLLASDDSGWVRQALASSPHAPAEILAHMVGDETVEVRRRVAENRQTPLPALQQLSYDPESVVRMWAGCHSLPAATLRRLAQDPDDSVQASVASNPNSPPDVLVGLAALTSLEVVGQLAGNPSIPVTILERLARDPLLWVRTRVAGNQSLPRATMERLLADTARNDTIVLAIARNPAAPPDLVEQLAKNASRHVRKAARQRMKAELQLG